MLPANLPPTYIQRSSAAEIRIYTAPLERAHDDEPVKIPYRLAEVSLTPIVGTAPLASVNFLPVYMVGTGQFSNSSLLPHTG